MHSIYQVNLGLQTLASVTRNTMVKAKNILDKYSVTTRMENAKTGKGVIKSGLEYFWYFPVIINVHDGESQKSLWLIITR